MVKKNKIKILTKRLVSGRYSYVDTLIVDNWFSLKDANTRLHCYFIDRNKFETRAGQMDRPSLLRRSSYLKKRKQKQTLQMTIF